MMGWRAHFRKTEKMASVFLADLDGDWIAPSQGCTNPIFSDSNNTQSVGAPPLAGKVVLSMEEDTSYKKPNLIHTATTQTGRVKASVSLNDCLACSGCVTSAETVLITEQSNSKLYEALANPSISKVVLTLSPQSLASLASNFDTPATQLSQLLVNFFSAVGAVLIPDTSVSAELSLLETAFEFITRFRQQGPPQWSQPELSLPYSSTRSLYSERPHQPLIETATDSVANYNLLPMLASSCPGFICYSEKTQHPVLPYISTTKSPQQIMGTLVKEIMSPQLGLDPLSVFHGKYRSDIPTYTRTVSVLYM
jgi:iron only hydrogenase large subunit-like protein